MLRGSILPLAHANCQAAANGNQGLSSVPPRGTASCVCEEESLSLSIRTTGRSADCCMVSATEQFPVNSLFLHTPFAKTRNPCGFSSIAEKNSLLFSLFSRNRTLARDSPRERHLKSGLPQIGGIPHLKTGNQTLWMLVCLARAPQDVNSHGPFGL